MSLIFWLFHSFYKPTSLLLLGAIFFVSSLSFAQESMPLSPVPTTSESTTVQPMNVDIMPQGFILVAGTFNALCPDGDYAPGDPYTHNCSGTQISKHSCPTGYIPQLTVGFNDMFSNPTTVTSGCSVSAASFNIKGPYSSEGACVDDFPAGGYSLTVDSAYVMFSNYGSPTPPSCPYLAGPVDVGYIITCIPPCTGSNCPPVYSSHC